MVRGSNENVLDEILTYSSVLEDPAGRTVRVIHESDAMKIAVNFDRTLNEIYIESLSASIWPYRYVRNQDTLSINDQRIFAESCVAVIGCGGLGGHVLSMLARIGIGSLVIADPDIFDESNLNRQAFAVSDTMGVAKTSATAVGIASINPAVSVKTFQKAVNSSNAAQIIHDADVVVDALDNIPDRKILKQIANQMQLPIVHGALAGFEGQVMTILPQNAPCADLIECVDDQSSPRDMSAELILGVPSITPVFIAALQAMEVIKVLLKKGNLFSSRMLYSDIELGEFNYFDF